MLRLRSAARSLRLGVTLSLLAASFALLAPAAPASALVMSLDANFDHSCAVRTDGTVACWGENEDGKVSPVPAGTYTQVTTGGGDGSGFSCGLTNEAAVACWGDPGGGETTPPAGAFTQISAGVSHVCAVDDDHDLVCWGDDGGFGFAPAFRAGPYSQVSTGLFITCGLRSDGTLDCFGSNTSGGLNNIPTGTFSQISTRQNTSCGVRTDGTLACWGAFIGAAPSGTFTQVGAGANHACAVDTTGGLTCWGANDFGMATPPAGTFTAVEPGYHHTCAIRVTGTVVCWGRNQVGQLGASPTISGTPGEAAPATPYSFTPAIGAGSPAGTFQFSGSMPPGLSFNPGDASISGTPTTPGRYPFTITGSNGIHDDAVLSTAIYVCTNAFTAGNDVLKGTKFADLICGGGGNDTLTGYESNDILYGGAGNDTFLGGRGNDVLDGGLGTDVAGFYDSGVAGTLTVNLTTGTATNAVLGTDTVIGFENADGSPGNDTITGTDARNIIDGRAGNDTLNGLGGADTLTGNTGDDTLNGGDGTDLLQPGLGGDTVNGDGGVDAVTYQEMSSPGSNGVFVSLADNTGTGTDFISDSVFGVENVFGSRGNDNLTGDDSPNQIYGLSGDDNLFAAEGFAGDLVNGGADFDQCFTDGAGDTEDGTCEV